jgi:hypothetical protein
VRYKASEPPGRGGHENGGVPVKLNKIVGLLAIALLIYFVIQQPGSAADSVQNILAFLGSAADSVVAFFTELV